jgi:holdfast attachment protein HfaA
MEPLMARYPSPIPGWRRVVAGAALLVLGASGPALAQTMSNNGSAYNAGYGRTTDQENQAVNVSMRDANGNLVVANGQLLSPTGSSVFSTTTTGGAGSSSTGVGVGATAIGNNLSVVTTGNYNTVIVNSHQSNTGAITATTSTSGGVGNAQ